LPSGRQAGGRQSEIPEITEVINFSNTHFQFIWSTRLYLPSGPFRST